MMFIALIMVWMHLTMRPGRTNGWSGLRLCGKTESAAAEEEKAAEEDDDKDGRNPSSTSMKFSLLSHKTFNLYCYLLVTRMNCHFFLARTETMSILCVARSSLMRRAEDTLCHAQPKTV